MRSGTPRVWAAALLALTASLACAALALACHPNASISLSPSEGPAGSTVTVTGKGFVPGETVQLGWNGARGAQIGSSVASTSGGFTTTVQIPEAPADTYTIVGYAPGAPAGGTVAAFTIPAPARSPEDGPQGGSPAPAPAPRTPSGAPGGPQTGEPISGSTSGGETAGPGGDGRGATTRTAAGADRGRAATRSGGGPSRAGVTTLRSGTSVFADSVTPTGAASRVAGRGTDEAGSRGPAGVPSGRSAADDLWSGFSSGRSPLALGSTARPPGGTGTVPPLSLALLGLGLSAALAGVFVAGTRRRRGPARAS